MTSKQSLLVAVFLPKAKIGDVIGTGPFDNDGKAEQLQALVYSRPKVNFKKSRLSPGYKRITCSISFYEW